MSQEALITQARRSNAEPIASVKLARRFRAAAVAASILVLLFAVADIIGWAFDVSLLKHPFGTLPSLQSGTSITLLFVTAALLLLFFRRSAPCLQTARTIGGVVLVVGALNLAEHLSGHDWGLAYPLYSPPSGLPLSYPGPMAPDVAFNFVVLGVALLLVDVGVRGRTFLFQIFALLVALPNIMILSSYAGGMPHLCAYFGCVRFSPITSLALTLASLSLIFLQADLGISSIFVYETTGGRIMRRASVAALALIPLLALVKAGEASGLYDANIAGGIMGLLICCLLGGCIAWGARRVDSVEAEKTQVVELLQDSLLEFSGQETRSLKGVCLTCAREFSDLSLTHCPDDGTELSKIADALKTGSVFADRYEILSLLGAGGISTVYLARQMHMEKKMALKLLHARFATETRYVQRFQREAMAVSKLSHPNIVNVYDFGISLQGQAYLAMEYLEGESLEELIARSGALPAREAVVLFMQICEGLNEAHVHGVIHRDLKPANIMIVPNVDKQKMAKIVDFGLAHADNADTQLTATGDVLGSPTYMSPEQCKGEPADARSDVYSMGSLMYDCLSGHPAINNDNVYETINIQINQPPPPFLPDLNLPAWLQVIVFRCLQKSVDKRPQSAAVLLQALREGMQSEVVA